MSSCPNFMTQTSMSGRNWKYQGDGHKEGDVTFILMPGMSVTLTLSVFSLTICQLYSLMALDSRTISLRVHLYLYFWLWWWSPGTIPQTWLSPGFAQGNPHWVHHTLLVRRSWSGDMQPSLSLAASYNMTRQKWLESMLIRLIIHVDSKLISILWTLSVVKLHPVGFL